MRRAEEEDDDASMMLTGGDERGGMVVVACQCVRYQAAKTSLPPVFFRTCPTPPRPSAGPPKRANADRSRSRGSTAQRIAAPSVPSLPLLVQCCVLSPPFRSGWMRGSTFLDDVRDTVYRHDREAATQSTSIWSEPSTDRLRQIHLVLRHSLQGKGESLLSWRLSSLPSRPTLGLALLRRSPYFSRSSASHGP